MTYTKVGPFTDYSNTVGLSAAYANGVETALAAVVPTTGTGPTYAAGGTFTINAPGYRGGTLLISASSGGSWGSVWFGMYACDGSSNVTVTQIGTTFTTTGQLITAVTGSTTSTTVTVTTANSGSAGTFFYTFTAAGAQS